MKKALLIAVLFASNMTYMHAQCEVDNPSFENWDYVPFEGTGIVTTDILMPDSIVNPFRLFLWIWESSSTINSALAEDPQGFAGIYQSTDASDGEFAVALQSKFPTIAPAADIFSVQDCTSPPDSVAVDIKHVGSGSGDRLQVYLMFSDTLQGLPSNSVALADEFPKSGFKFISNIDDTPYIRYSIPIQDNFDEEINLFYYDIVAVTSDSTYYLVDNIELIYNNIATEDLELRNAVSLLQNPIYDNLNVLIQQRIEKAVTVNIVDMSGRTLQRETYQNLNDHLEYDLSAYPSGTYVLQLVSEDGVASYKFIKM